MKLLITGAESFVGRALVDKCRLTGIEHVGIDLVADRPETLARDIRNRDLAGSIPEGVDAVVHLAAISRDPDCRRDPPACYDVNVAGTVNVFEAARARGARQFVFASTEWVYGAIDPAVARREDDPVDFTALASDYALSKLTAEQALRIRHLETGMPVTVLRLGIIYGPRRTNFSAVEALLAAVAYGGPVRIGSRATARCFVHIDDIADGILAAIGRDGYDVINLAGDRPVTLGEIVDCSARLLARQPTLGDETEPAASGQAGGVESSAPGHTGTSVIRRFSRRMTEVGGASENLPRVQVIETDPASPSVRNVSNEKAKELLGWRPQIDMATGLRTVADYLGLLAEESR